mmetsp:Transcript_58521/g.124156  ORF Transcript_58521/g.124156 Transcript_58521/m.124156 type:complete len:266 (+) Transcript_58521:89-886(+)
MDETISLFVQSFSFFFSSTSPSIGGRNPGPSLPIRRRRLLGHALVQRLEVGSVQHLPRLRDRLVLGKGGGLRRRTGERGRFRGGSDRSLGGDRPRLLLARRERREGAHADVVAVDVLHSRRRRLPPARRRPPAGSVSRRTMAMAGTDEADGSTMYFDLVERPLQMAFAEGYTLGRRRREMAAGIVGTEDAVERTRRLRRGWMRCAAREDEGRWRFFLDPRGMLTFLIHFAAGSKKNYDRFVVSSIHSKSAPMTSLPLKFTNATCS